MKHTSTSAKPDQTVNSELAKIYLDPEDPGSYGGVERLYKRAKELAIKGASRNVVKRYLSQEASYSLHKRARRRFARNPTYVQGIDDQWQADLVDVHQLSRQNHGIHFLLTCIDVFSKYAWVVPVKAKSAEAMVAAFEELFAQAHPRFPRRLQTDKGKEFLNGQVQARLRSLKHFYSWSDQKAAVVERFNRTLKERMWRYFSAHQTNRYLDILPKLVQAYNHTWHRAIGAVPAHVSKSDEQRIAQRLYQSQRARGKLASGCSLAPEATAISQSLALGGRRRRPSSPSSPPPKPPARMHEEGPSNNQSLRLEPGQMVRISSVKGAFEKGYLPNWSEEDFRIRDVFLAPAHSPSAKTVYKLEDRSGEPIQGSWYPEELEPISQNRYLVERIIRRRGLANSTSIEEALVKWRGWPTKFNTWVPISDLQRLGEIDKANIATPVDNDKS